MPNFASSKTRCGASRHANTPRKACSLDCITKLRFAFQLAPASKTVRPDISRQPANFFTVTASQRLSVLILYRALCFPVVIASLPAPAGNSLSPHIFSYQPSQPLASPQPSFRLDRPVYSRSHSFSLFLPFHSTHKKRKPAKPISFSFSCNPKSSSNLVQASPSQSPSLLFLQSSQYTLPHRPRSGHT